MGATRAPGGSPKRERASAMSAFAPLLRGGGEAGVGPESAASRSSRKLTDPLGLASDQAMTGVGGGAAQDAGASAPTGSGNALVDTGSSGDTERARSGSHGGRGGDRGRSDTDPSTTSPAKDARQPLQDRNAARVTNEQPQDQARPAGGQPRTAPSTAGKIRGVSQTTISGSGSVSGSAANTGRGAGPPGSVVTSVQSAASGRSESTKPPAPAERPTQVLREEKAEVAPQLSKSLASLLMRKGGSMQIQLRPEALGRVQVGVTLTEGVVSATLEAETDSARRLLGSELDRLRSMLEHRGLRVERLEVIPGRAERETPALNEERPGGWRTPTQDDPGASGKDAGGGSPWSGDEGRARGGDPGGHAERDRPGVTARAAESGEPGTGDVDASVRRSPGSVSIRLDTVA